LLASCLGKWTALELSVFYDCIPFLTLLLPSFTKLQQLPLDSVSQQACSNELQEEQAALAEFISQLANLHTLELQGYNLCYVSVCAAFSSLLHLFSLTLAIEVENWAAPRAVAAPWRAVDWDASRLSSLSSLRNLLALTVVYLKTTLQVAHSGAILPTWSNLQSLYLNVRDLSGQSAMALLEPEFGQFATGLRGAKKLRSSKHSHARFCGWICSSAGSSDAWRS
jgi:hypothetical protein